MPVGSLDHANYPQRQLDQPLVSDVFRSCAVPSVIPFPINTSKLTLTFDNLAGRAMTYSFGSISFGSLGVAVTTTIQLCSENMYFKFIAILLRGILSMFNEYAFSYLAIFNTSYCSAAKTTSRIMRDRAIVLLVNQCLVNAALVSGAFFVGSICCFYSLLLIACNVVKTDTSVTLVMLIPLWTFFVAFQCCSVVLSPIRSGVTTIFVGMALEPEVMKKEHQELYGSMVKFYPQLEKAVV